MKPVSVLCESLQRVLDEGDFDSALSLCQERVDADFNDADAHRYLALVHAAQGRRGLAVRAARRACELAPADARTWSDLGRVHIHAGKSLEAIECFRRAVQLDPRYADGWHNLGTALKQSGEREPTFAALKNALLLDPARAETYLNLGNLLIASEIRISATRPISTTSRSIRPSIEG